MSEVEITTYTGKIVAIDETTPEMIDVRDIAHGLSLQCRFNGQCREFYSVAEHCVRVSHAVEEAMLGAYSAEYSRFIAFAGLMHDAPEAYIGDVITQIKRKLPLFRAFELIVGEAIGQRYGLPYLEPPVVKHFDYVLFATEVRDIHLHPYLFKILPDIIPLEDRIVPWPAHVAEQLWLERFYQLGGK